MLFLQTSRGLTSHIATVMYGCTLDPMTSLLDVGTGATEHLSNYNQPHQSVMLGLVNG